MYLFITYLSVYGPAIIEHVLLSVGISPAFKVKDFNLEESVIKLIEAFHLAETIIDTAFSSTNKV